MNYETYFKADFTTSYMNMYPYKKYRKQPVKYKELKKEIKAKPTQFEMMI